MRSNQAPVGMHYVVFEIWPDGTELFIMESKDRLKAKQAMEEAWQRLLSFPNARIGLRCIDD